MLKKLSLLSLVMLMIPVGLYLFGVYQNNRYVTPPTDVEIRQQLEESIQWLVEHEKQLITQTNPMLWWMLYEVQKISPDDRIDKLLSSYFQRNARVKASLWGPLFDEVRHSRLGAYSVTGLPYYNQHFIYALNCASEIADELSLVARQNNETFCHQSNYIYRPACITHQLMGINFLRTKDCNFVSNLDEVTRSLQDDIVSQLTWDIRVVDVYLQRVLMLLITGAEDRVKPVWIQQVLHQQLNDGGWGNFDSIVTISGQNSLGFSARIFSLGSEKSTFHATAQGVYILSYLISGGATEVGSHPSDELNNT